MWRMYAGIALCLSLAAGGLYYGHTRFEAGVASQQGAIRKAQAEAQNYIDQRDALADQITRDARAELHDALSQGKDAADKAAQKVRIVYKDHPVSPSCERPDGVRDELEASRERANAAARGMHGTST